MRKVLIAVPDLSLPGGIANIYRALNWEISGPVKYFINTATKPIQKIWFIPVMFIRFVINIRGIHIIQLNPSLNRKCVIREGLLLLIGKLCGKKVIVFFHGWDNNYESRINSSRFNRSLFRWVFNRSDAFLLLGEVFKQKLEGMGIHNKNYFFLPTVADTQYFQKAQHKYSNTITILFISRFVPLKGIDIVLQTFHHLQLNSVKYNFKLIMAGNGIELGNATNYVEKYKLENVTFTGHIEGLAKHNCYKNADILFLPSCYAEGLPCVIMEGMLYGLAIVTRPIGGIPHWVKHHKNGWVSASTNPLDFAQGIMSLVSDFKMLEQISKRNQSVALKNFTPDSFIEQLQNIYKELLDEKNIS